MISLLYATARPHLISDVIARWSKEAEDTFITIVCTDDIVDKDIRQKLIKEYRLVNFVINNGLPNCVDAYNKAASEACGDILIQISDDLYPCKRWDTLIESELDARRAEVLLINDDHLGRQEVTRHAICTLRYYEKLGYFLHPSYESMYSDDDFNEMAKLHADKVIDARSRIRFEHKHCGQYDEVAQLHEAPGRYSSGRANFERRRSLGFPI